MTSNDFRNLIKTHLATVAIGPSALRNQGAPGIIEIARQFLSSLDFSPYNTSNPQHFATQLDVDTNRLIHAWPLKGRSWGAARKALNLFLRDAIYNHWFHNDLSKAYDFLEIPLDSYVATNLKTEYSGQLPRWRQIKTLTPDESILFQNAALELAKLRGINRVDLDIVLWRRP